MACPNHGPEFACLECQDADTTDGVGFPHPGNCKGRTPVRKCEHCNYFVAREVWRSEHQVPYRDGCGTCVPDGTPAGPFPRKQKAAATPPEGGE